MRIYKEMNLSNFDFWGGARDRVKYLSGEDLDFIGRELEMCHNTDLFDETEINDFFWFEEDTVADMLGYADFDELMEDRKDWI